MSDAYKTRIVASTTQGYGFLTAATAGVATLVAVLGCVGIVRASPEGTLFAGAGSYDLFAALLAVVGVGLLVAGLGSATGRFETDPDEWTTAPVALCFGSIAGIAAALVASETLGFGSVVWVPVGLLAALGGIGAILFSREDLGTTVPPAALSLGVAAVVFADVIGPGWLWEPANLSGAFTPQVVVPALSIVCGLLGAWSAASAHGRFGTMGRQRGARMLVSLNAFAMIAVLVVLVLFIVQRGFAPATQGFQLWPFEWPFVTNNFSFRPERVTGIYPAIVGTAWVVVGAVFVGVPLAVGSAVFLTEYTDNRRLEQIVEVATNGLWSTPSVVFGLFGYAFLVPRFGNSTSILAGMLVLGFMLLPLALITSREAIKAVPDEYRDASAALGVSKWQTTKSVVVPAAAPGIVTGVILGVGRIAGETAPILLVMAGGLRDDAPNVLGSFEFTSAPPYVANDALLTSAPTLPYQLYASITAGVSGENAEAIGWATALVLLLVVLSFYAIGIGTRAYFRRRLHQ
ncbi:phosphate ABC transporter permease PstA [Halorubrum sp. AD140]|uniref:phosphate ABC transporter permease PstA n=1 Tax=Halorubrum sp. AD140 TaxID=3050073 RepID=UPI002ACC445E|nr:phosphate ABC transporter permease PstA [Halorubrum sp. AD140]MDZ5812173.1 phosphate ABC transporter permease PstA [Halorubrum sp. AD140]